MPQTGKSKLDIAGMKSGGERAPALQQGICLTKDTRCRTYRYDLVSRRLLMWVSLLVLGTWSPLHAGQAASCRQSAHHWYQVLAGADQALLTRRTAAKCDFAARWIRAEVLEAQDYARERACKDLVLLWTYKECIYLREHVDHRAYDPCTAWSREMNARCLEGDIDWFER